MRISIVIPTKDREKSLIECVLSIKNQTFLPYEVLVIDDGEIKKETKIFLKKELEKKGIIFRYFKKEKPSLARSKNLGAKKSQGEIILFLDDDVVLEKDYLENLVKVWEREENNQKLAGVSGLMKNASRKSFFEKIFLKLFFLSSKKSWAILPWGYQVWNHEIKKEEKADWIPGGISSFRKEIFKEFQFKELQPGRTALEDLEFCWQIKKKGYFFIITPQAKLLHKEEMQGKEKAFISGFKEGYNRCLIFSLHAKKTFKNYLIFIIASFGWVLRQFLGSFWEPRYFFYHFFYGLGLIKGKIYFLKNSLHKKLQSKIIK